MPPSYEASDQSFYYGMGDDFFSSSSCHGGVYASPCIQLVIEDSRHTFWRAVEMLGIPHPPIFGLQVRLTQTSLALPLGRGAAQV